MVVMFGLGVVEEFGDRSSRMGVERVRNKDDDAEQWQSNFQRLRLEGITLGMATWASTFRLFTPPPSLL
jgi:hypothetical protein